MGIISMGVKKLSASDLKRNVKDEVPPAAPVRLVVAAKDVTKVLGIYPGAKVTGSVDENRVTIQFHRTGVAAELSLRRSLDKAGVRLWRNE